MNDLYSKKDVLNALNYYVEQLKQQRSKTCGVIHDVLTNVITSLEEITNGFDK